MNRTYVRRRMISALLVVLGIWLGVPAVSGAAGGPELGEAAVGQAEYVVQPGDTMWALAVRLEPSEDPRVVAQRIAEENQVRDYRITPGQLLVLPVGG